MDLTEDTGQMADGLTMADIQAERTINPTDSSPNRYLTRNFKIIIIIIIKIESAVQGRERVITLSIRRPQPHTTNQSIKQKEKIVGDKKKEQIRPS